MNSDRLVIRRVKNGWIVEEHEYDMALLTDPVCHVAQTPHDLDTIVAVWATKHAVVSSIGRTNLADLYEQDEELGRVDHNDDDVRVRTAGGGPNMQQRSRFTPEAEARLNELSELAATTDIKIPPGLDHAEVFHEPLEVDGKEPPAIRGLDETEALSEAELGRPLLRKNKRTPQDRRGWTPD